MFMDIKCPECGNYFVIPEDEAVPGNRIPCPFCDSVVEIPISEATESAVDKEERDERVDERLEERKAEKKVREKGEIKVERVDRREDEEKSEEKSRRESEKKEKGKDERKGIEKIIRRDRKAIPHNIRPVESKPFPMFKPAGYSIITPPTYSYPYTPLPVYSPPAYTPPFPQPPGAPQPARAPLPPSTAPPAYPSPDGHAVSPPASPVNPSPIQALPSNPPPVHAHFNAGYYPPVSGYSAPVAMGFGIIPSQMERAPFFKSNSYLKITGFGVLMFYILLSLNFITLLYSLYLVPHRMTDNPLIPIYFVVPFPPFVIGFNVEGTPQMAAAYHLILAGIILFSLYLMLRKDGEGFFRIIEGIFYREEPPDDNTVQEFENNSLVLLGEVFMAIIFFDYVFYFGLFMLGVNTHVPEELTTDPAYKLMYLLARASVWEEVIARILFIGLPLLLLRGIKEHYAKKGNKGNPATPPTENQSDMGQNPSEGLPWYRYLIGGGFEITPLTSGLILFSAVLFGLAHSGGWDYYKVIPTAISGLAFGYLFLKKGVHISIMLHFAFDYMGLIGRINGSGFVDSVIVGEGLIILVIFFIGALTFYNLSVRVLKFVRGMLFPEHRSEARAEWE